MNKEEFTKLHPWKSSTLSDFRTLAPGLSKCNKHVCVRTGVAHKSFSWMEPIPSKYIDMVDGHEWELFHAYAEDEMYYWGMWVEGIGSFDVMAPKEFTRELLPHEREAWSKVTLGMYDSHSGEFSYSLPSGVSPNG